MKTWVKWTLSVIISLIIFAFAAGLTYLITCSMEGHEIPETVRVVIALVGFSLMLILTFVALFVAVKDMLDIVEEKRK